MTGTSSPITAASNCFVPERLDPARALGARLPALVAADTVARLRHSLDGIRRRPGAPSTSISAAATRPAAGADRSAATALRSTAP